MDTEKLIQTLRFNVGNLRWNLANDTAPHREDFNRGRLEAYEDVLQMLTGNRGEDIE